MSLATPTTQEVYQNILAGLEASLNQTIPLLPKSFLMVLAKVLAGVYITLYKYGGYTHLSQFVQTAAFAETTINGVLVSPLKFWGSLVGLPEPTAATNAELVVQVNVENQIGSLASGQQLIGNTNGVTYLSLNSVLLNAATVELTIKAVQDEQGEGGRGVIGNLAPGEIVSFAKPLDNVARDTTVLSQAVTAANAQSEASYRQAILDRFQKRPQGGAYADYELWGEEVEGIVNVYPYTSASCPGGVDVYVEATPESSGNPDGIPTTAQLEAVYDSIQLDENGLASRRPAGALVNTLPITRSGFDVTVTGIADVADLAATQQSITNAIAEYFLAREPFIEGLSVPPRKDRISNAAIGGIVEDIVTADGGIFTDTELFVSGSLSAIDIYPLGEGEKSKSVLVTFL